MSFLQLNAVEKTYPDGTRAVKGVDLSINEGEFIVLLGPSGCGKTTTLRMIAGLELATKGTISLGGRDVTSLRPARRDIGMVFQFYALYPHLTIRDNIGFPLRAAGLQPAEIKSRVDTVAERMGLTPLLRQYPTQLAGGDQQKVSLARAIVRRPAVYLMDEPLGTLDSDQRLAMRELIRTEQLSSGVTTIYVTHDQEEAMSLADRIVVMAGGNIQQIGTPAEVYDRPQHVFVATFVGSPGMNLVPGRITGVNGALQFVSERGQVQLNLPREATREPPPAASTTLGIRCEHVHEHPEGPIRGRVLSEEYLGNARIVHVDTECGRLVVRTDPTRARSPGSDIRLSFDPSHISVFDGSSEARL